MNSQCLGPSLFEYGDLVRHKATGVSGWIAIVGKSYERITHVYMLADNRDTIIGDPAVGVDFDLVRDCHDKSEDLSMHT